jgi:iron complex outermembrane recepter protein
MMKRVLYAISILFLTGAASAQDTAGVGSMTGTVATSAGRPVDGVRVCVSSTIRCSTTGGDGTFRLTGIRAGDQRLEITAPGQPPILSQSISIRAGLDFAVDVTLPELTAAQQSPCTNRSLWLPKK